MHEVSNYHKIPSAAAAVHNVSDNKLRDFARTQTDNSSSTARRLPHRASVGGAQRVLWRKITSASLAQLCHDLFPCLFGNLK